MEAKAFEEYPTRSVHPGGRKIEERTNQKKTKKHHIPISERSNETSLTHSLTQSRRRVVRASR